MTGDCVVHGDCVSSKNYPSWYGNNERCTITMLRNAKVSVGSPFSHETYGDQLMIRGNDVEDSSSVPAFLNVNEEFTWRTDDVVTREGWKLCFSEAETGNV